jgi:hypothetical protein
MRVITTYPGPTTLKGLHLAHKLPRRRLFCLEAGRKKAMSDQGWVQFAVMLAALGLVMVQVFVG